MAKLCRRCKINALDPNSDYLCTVCENERQRQRNKRRRELVLAHYSGGTPRCACCGVTEVVFLVIDHIDGGGNKHRRATSNDKPNGYSTYTWLKKQGFPPGYRVLCHNCNWAIRSLGACPHVSSPPVTSAL